MKRKIRPGIVYLFIVTLILLIVIYSPIFTLKRINAEGMRFLTNEDIVRICAVPYGTPIFSLETDEITKRLLNDLRIENAVVRRNFPSDLDIMITERTPIATVGGDKYYLAIDKVCVIIDAYSDPKTSEVPNISGIYLENVFIGDEANNEILKRIISYLAAMDAKYLREIKEFQVIDGIVTGKTQNDIYIRLGDLSDLEVKAKLTENFLEDFKTNPIPAEYVDFHYNAPFIKLKEETVKEETVE